MSTIDTDFAALTAGVQALSDDVTAEEALGTQILAGVNSLEAAAAAGAPDLKPAIAILQSLHTKVVADIAAGGTLLASLTPTPPAPPVVPPAV